MLTLSIMMALVLTNYRTTDAEPSTSKTVVSTVSSTAIQMFSLTSSVARSSQISPTTWSPSPSSQISTSTCSSIVNVQAFDPPEDITRRGGTYGSFGEDPVTGKVYYMDGTYNVRSLSVYPNMADYINSSNVSNYRLPKGCDGAQSQVINNKLYCSEYDAPNVLVYNLSNVTQYRNIPLLGGGYRNKCHYHWGGYSDIDIAYDGRNVYILWAKKAGNCQFIISKIDMDDNIEQTWNTSISKWATGQAFIICDKMYVVHRYSRATFISAIYDLHISQETSGYGLAFNSGHAFNSHTHYNPTKEVLYSWDNGYQVRIGVKFKPTDAEPSTSKTIVSTVSSLHSTVTADQMFTLTSSLTPPSQISTSTWSPNLSSEIPTSTWSLDPSSEIPTSTWSPSSSSHTSLSAASRIPSSQIPKTRWSLTPTSLISTSPQTLTPSSQILPSISSLQLSTPSSAITPSHSSKTPQKTLHHSGILPSTLTTFLPSVFATQTTSGVTAQPRVESNNSGVVVGAAIGGAIAGIVITLLGVFLVTRYMRKKSTNGYKVHVNTEGGKHETGEATSDQADVVTDSCTQVNTQNTSSGETEPSYINMINVSRDGTFEELNNNTQRQSNLYTGLEDMKIHEGNMYDTLNM